jgi:2'-5' RNA ligase
MQKQYYRTFIGLPVRVGKDFIESRERLMKELTGERISWVEPDRYHITLRFIGDTEIGTTEIIGNSLGDFVGIPKKFLTQMDLLGSFGPRNNPRVVWVGFGDDGDFRTLKTHVDGALDFCGIPSLEQPFRAHITLCRIRRLYDLPHFYRTLEIMQHHFSQEVMIDRLIFYRSEAGRGGPLYTPLKIVEFGD